MAANSPHLRTHLVIRHTAAALCIALSAPCALAQPRPIPSVVAGHLATLTAGPAQNTARAATEQYANPGDDARDSELKHHLAGWLVVLAGVFLVVEPTLRRRWPAAHYAWPYCFLACGLFLLVFSDTELWPVGRESWWYGVTHDPEDLQHKLFALILLLLGAIELQRARGRLRSAWAAWAFPLLALAGSLMLLMHQHSAPMPDASHMVAMKHVEAQHVTFAIAGGGIAIAKGLSEVRTQWQGVFLRSWPLLLIGLGVLLIRYAET